MRLVSTLFKLFLLLVLLGANDARTSELLTDKVVARNAPIRVVTSFTILEDLVNELGGEFVNVVNLVGPDADAHTYHPKPSDAIALTQADLVVFNGLAFEGWMSRLIENSGYVNRQLIASRGVDIISHGDEPDPHAWQSFRNIRVYVRNITRALIAQRPQHADALKERQQQYLNALTALEEQLLSQVSDIPISNRVVVTSHDAFGYLGRDFQIRFLAPVGFSFEVDATAADVASVIDQIREQNVRALFVENIASPRLIQRIADDAGIAVGGPLYSDALSEAQGPASTYREMMRYNVESLVIALTPGRQPLATQGHDTSPQGGQVDAR